MVHGCRSGGGGIADLALLHRRKAGSVTVVGEEVEGVGVPGDGGLV